MSYITCSWCGKRGHNRRGCPELKAFIKDNPTSAEARERSYYDASTSRAVSNRSCSYCRERGHTRRTCPTLRRDKENIIKRQIEYRKAWISEAASVGLGPGAIVVSPRGPQWYGGDDAWKQTITSIIVSPDWENINFLNIDAAGGCWFAKSRSAFIGRIIKTCGYEKSSRGWVDNPSQGDKEHINTEDIMITMSSSYSVAKDWISSGKYPQAKIIAPSYKEYVMPSIESNITDTINESFHLLPRKNAPDRLKEREEIHWSKWRNVNREEYMTYVTEHPGRMERLKEIEEEHRDKYGRPFL